MTAYTLSQTIWFSYELLLLLSAYRAHLPAAWSVSGMREALREYQSSLYYEEDVQLVDPDALGHVCYCVFIWSDLVYCEQAMQNAFFKKLLE